ncbi:MFS transporter [Halorussus salinus]|uniref:MFS transporter n=1 Tax=Halorussus salinus TaxID=1364935 RepID=UPI0010923D97|nr:MFS transporter [Halorussus salinus]
MSTTNRLGEYVAQVTDGVLRNDKLRALFPAFVGIFLVGELYKQALPLYFEAVGIPLAVLGVVKSAANAVEIGVSPVAGVLADRTDRMGLAAVAAVAASVVLAAFALRPGRAVVTGLVVLTAVALLLLNNAITPAVNAALEEGVEGIGWGVRDVGMYLGSGVGLAAAGALVSRTERVEVIFLVAVPVLLGVGAVAWRRRSGGALRAALSDIELDDLFAIGVREQVRSVSNRRLLYAFCLVELATTAGMGMTMFLLPALATDLGLAASGYLFVYSASRLVGAPASLVGGVAADHLPKKWLFVANYAVEGAMLVAFGLADGPALFLVGMALFVVQTTFEPGVVAYFFDNFDDEEGGTIWGIKGSVHKVANVAAPVVGGGLYAIDPHLSFLAGGGLMLVGSGIATTLPR